MTVVTSMLLWQVRVHVINYGRLGSYDTLSMILHPPKITMEYTVIIKMLALNENDLHHSCINH